MPPLDVEYADDTDFVSSSRSFLDEIERIAPACLAEWSLTINASKTERTSISRHADRIQEEWRMTRKLGSLLGEAEDVVRRKQLANVAFRKLWTLWFRRSQISLQLRLRLYLSFVVPVQYGYMGTHEIRTRSSGCVPASSSTPDHRHMLATSHFQRGTVPPLPMPSHQRSCHNCKMESIRARAPYATRCTRSASD